MTLRRGEMKKVVDYIKRKKEEEEKLNFIIAMKCNKHPCTLMKLTENQTMVKDLSTKYSSIHLPRTILMSMRKEKLKGPKSNLY